jgi:hypothetical protein
LSLKATLDPKSGLGLVEIRETASDSEVIAPNNYNNDIIIINISYNKSERSETQNLAKYIYTT